MTTMLEFISVGVGALDNNDISLNVPDGSSPYDLLVRDVVDSFAFLMEKDSVDYLDISRCSIVPLMSAGILHPTIQKPLQKFYDTYLVADEEQ
jgi:hypothetical protein